MIMLVFWAYLQSKAALSIYHSQNSCAFFPSAGIIFPLPYLRLVNFHDMPLSSYQTVNFILPIEGY
jgi:hypothetical protein